MCYCALWGLLWEGCVFVLCVSGEHVVQEASGHFYFVLGFAARWEAGHCCFSLSLSLSSFNLIFKKWFTTPWDSRLNLWISIIWEEKYSVAVYYWTEVTQNPLWDIPSHTTPANGYKMTRSVSNFLNCSNSEHTNNVASLILGPKPHNLIMKSVPESHTPPNVSCVTMWVWV